MRRDHAHANTHDEFVATNAHTHAHHDEGCNAHEDHATITPAQTGHVPTQVDGRHGTHADSSTAAVAAARQHVRVDEDEHSAVDANTSSEQASTSALTIVADYDEHTDENTGEQARQAAAGTRRRRQAMSAMAVKRMVAFAQGSAAQDIEMVNGVQTLAGGKRTREEQQPQQQHRRGREQQQVDSEEQLEQRRLTRAGARRLDEREMRRTVHGSESEMRCEGETSGSQTGPGGLGDRTGVG